MVLMRSDTEYNRQVHQNQKMHVLYQQALQEAHHAKMDSESAWHRGLLVGLLLGAAGAVFVEFSLRVLFGG